MKDRDGRSHYALFLFLFLTSPSYYHTPPHTITNQPITVVTMFFKEQTRDMFPSQAAWSHQLGVRSLRV